MRSGLKGLIALGCCSIMALSGGLLTGCSAEETKEQTEAVIDATTSIIPVAYTKELAQGILANALAASLKETNVKSDYTQKVYTFGGINVEPSNNYTVSTVYIEDGEKITEKTVIAGLGGESIEAYAITIMQQDGSPKYYSLYMGKYEEIKQNIYGSFGHQNNSSVGSMYSRFYLTGGEVVASDDGHVLTVSLANNVIGGRYFDGKTYINAKFDYSGDWGSNYSEKKILNAEYVIEDGRVTSVRILTDYKNYFAGDDATPNTEDDELCSAHSCVVSISYTYGGQVIDNAPTSLDGYTEGSATAKLV